MTLPEELKEKLTTQLIAYEEEQKVTYITSFEEIGIKKGEKLGIEKGKKLGKEEGKLQKNRENIIKLLKIRFKQNSQALFESFAKKLAQIENIAQLDILFEKAATLETTGAFESELERVLADKQAESSLANLDSNLDKPETNNEKT